jgi:hypothetical protein
VPSVSYWIGMGFPPNPFKCRKEWKFMWRNWTL